MEWRIIPFLLKPKIRTHVILMIFRGSEDGAAAVISAGRRRIAAKETP
jgi:hypothetical protein